MADPQLPFSRPDQSPSPNPHVRVPLSFDGQEWHFHHQQTVPRTIELIAALMVEEHGDGEPYRLPEEGAPVAGVDLGMGFPGSLAEQVRALAGTEAEVVAASGKRGACPPWEGRMAS